MCWYTMFPREYDCINAVATALFTLAHLNIHEAGRYVMGILGDENGLALEDIAINSQQTQKRSERYEYCTICGLKRK